MTYKIIALLFSVATLTGGCRSQFSAHIPEQPEFWAFEKGARVDLREVIVSKGFNAHEVLVASSEFSRPPSKRFNVDRLSQVELAILFDYPMYRSKALLRQWVGSWLARNHSRLPCYIVGTQPLILALSQDGSAQLDQMLAGGAPGHTPTPFAPIVGPEDHIFFAGSANQGDVRVSNLVIFPLWMEQSRGDFTNRGILLKGPIQRIDFDRTFTLGELFAHPTLESSLKSIPSRTSEISVDTPK